MGKKRVKRKAAVSTLTVKNPIWVKVGFKMDKSVQPSHLTVKEEISVIRPSKRLNFSVRNNAYIK